MGPNPENFEPTILNGPHEQKSSDHGKRAVDRFAQKRRKADYLPRIGRWVSGIIDVQSFSSSIERFKDQNESRPAVCQEEMLERAWMTKYRKNGGDSF